MTSVSLLQPAGLVHSPAFSHVAVLPPDATQILIGGQEADTLAGHVDLRRPLRKNESLIQHDAP